jgi:aryl-alcohol dehydrogenase-like predicted oxidoreductase
MIDLRDLSPIGFGGYRLDEHDPLHRQALLQALDSGCNLIDTSSNYGNGASERLIGAVLRESRRDAFVVTKAGYVDGANLHILGEACRWGLPPSAIARMSEQALYCIHPQYLRMQMDESRRRLGRGTLDAVLLHNPEHAASGGQAILPLLLESLAFLEQCVEEGGLRFYGISSNTIDVELLAALPALPHFRFLELPLNLVERDALPVIAAARARGLITLANRPLNAMTPQGPVRLTTDDEDPGDSAAILAEAMNRMHRRLRDAGEEDVMRFDVLRVLSARLTSLGTADAVDALFAAHFFPLVEALDELDEEGDAEAFRALYATALAHARRNNARAAAAIRARVEDEGLIPRDGRPLPVVACERLLSWGADHVLVGMRRPEYVEQLQELFPCAATA